MMRRINERDGLAALVILLIALMLSACAPQATTVRDIPTAAPEKQTPTSDQLAAWVATEQIPVLPTRIFEHFRTVPTDSPPPRRRNLGELAIQETMSEFALKVPPKTGVFLFEDHRIARASFVVPDNCRKVSTRAFLIFLEQRGWIESAAEIERRAVQAGRAFSTLRFPP